MADDAAHDFSATVAPTNGRVIVVERSEYFNYKGIWDGGHDAMGATSPASTFYFAEGTTRPGFDHYIAVMNPGTKRASVKATYLLGNGATRTQDLAVGPRSRGTLHPADVVGVGDDSAHDFSCKLVSTNGVNVVAERPMYFNYKGVWTGGSDVVGATAPSAEWFFAEGTTRPDFDTYITIANPQDEQAVVKVTYMTADSHVAEQTLRVGPHARGTIHPADIMGTGDAPVNDFSMRVQSVNGVSIVAERSMYFDYRGTWTGGHDVLGATSPASTFHFAEGTTRPDFDPYITIQNPGRPQANVAITYMRGDGKTTTAGVTVHPSDMLGVGDDPAHDFSTVVRCTNGREIICERPMYFNYRGAWSGGSDALGYAP